MHVVYSYPEANLDGSADGSIAQVKAIPGITKFTSSKDSVVVSGLQGRTFTINFESGGQSIDHYGLVFVRGSEMWQIQVVIHGGGNRKSLEDLKNAIFESVEIR